MSMKGPGVGPPGGWFALYDWAQGNALGAPTGRADDPSAAFNPAERPNTGSAAMAG